MAQRRRKPAPKKQAARKKRARKRSPAGNPEAGNGGIVPPEQHRFKPGPDPRRSNRDTAGAIAKNYLNGMARHELTSKQLGAIVADETQPHLKRAAAEQLLHSKSTTTLADFDDWLTGAETIQEIADRGVDMSLVKRATITAEGGRHIELHDRAGQNLDRVLQHTDLSPGEAEKYERIDAGLATERFEGVEIIIPGMPIVSTKPAQSIPAPVEDAAAK